MPPCSFASVSGMRVAHIHLQASVSITHSNQPPQQKVVDARKIGSIPAPYREKFNTDFVPSVIRWVSKLEEPWNNLDGKVPLQAIHDTVYKTVDGILDRCHPLVDPVSRFTPPLAVDSLTLKPTSQLKSKLTAWRGAIKKRATKLINDHLDDKENISPATSIREYIGWLKPDTNGMTDAPDTPFMFSNGLSFKAPTVWSPSSSVVTFSHANSAPREIPKPTPP